MVRWISRFQAKPPRVSRAHRFSKGRLRNDSQPPAAAAISSVPEPAGGVLSLVLATQRSPKAERQHTKAALPGNGHAMTARSLLFGRTVIPISSRCQPMAKALQVKIKPGPLSLCPVRPHVIDGSARGVVERPLRGQRRIAILACVLLGPTSAMNVCLWKYNIFRTAGV